MKKYIGTFVFAVLLFAAISVVIDLSEKVDDLIEHRVPLYEILFTYYLNFIPYIIALISPFILFIALVFFTSKMAYNNEIIAILASGINFYRILVPYFIGSLIISLILLYGNHQLVPRANSKRLAFENAFIHTTRSKIDRNIHLQIQPDTYIYLETFNMRDSVGYRFAAEKIVDGQLKSKLFADRIEWKPETKKWRLFNSYIRVFDEDEEHIISGKVVDTSMAFLPAEFGKTVSAKEEMTTPELKRFIREEREKGVAKLEFYEIELYRRTADVFTIFILTLIGVAISSRKLRGGRGLHIVFGLIMAFGFIVIARFSTTFSTNANLPPIWGVWLPNVFFLLIGILMVRKAPK